MDRQNLFHRFQLDDHCFLPKQVQPITAIKRYAFVFHRQLDL
jgi:hypothetical protein